MSILTEAYYSKDINLTAEQAGKVATSWQATYEEVILKRLLGYDLYALYAADLATTPATPQNPTEQRFKDLVDGKVFTFDYCGNTVTKEWKGLRDSTLKKSLIAYYVYYQYRNEEESFNSGAGQVTSNTENSSKIDVTPKLISAWNKMIDLYGQVPNQYINKDLFLNQGNYKHFNSEPSAYNFLLANKETYPEWIFEPIVKQNIFGI